MSEPKRYSWEYRFAEQQTIFPVITDPDGKRMFASDVVILLNNMVNPVEYHYYQESVIDACHELLDRKQTEALFTTLNRIDKKRYQSEDNPTEEFSDQFLQGTGVTTFKSNNLAAKYPHYHKSVSNLETIDVYRVCQLFGVDDSSGCVQHAIKKLLVSGNRGGGKSRTQDIDEAIATLRRYQAINSENS